MKKSLLSVFFISFLTLLVSCGNLLNRDNTSQENTQSQTQLVLNLQAKNIRTASPLDDSHSFEDITQWTVTAESPLTDQSAVVNNVTLSTDKTLSVTLPVAPSYNITLKGALTVNETDYIYCGKLTGISVAVSEQKTLDVYVELEKTENGKGSLECTVAIPDEYSADSSTLLGIELWNLSSPASTTDYVYSTAGDDPVSFASGKITKEINNLPSGFYGFKVFYKRDNQTYYLATGENVVEIADDLLTVLDTRAYAYTSKTYYATTSASEYNGLTPSYPINLKTLLGKITDGSIEAEEVNIYLPQDTDLKAEASRFPQVSGSPKINAYRGTGLFFKGASYVSEVYVGEEGKISGSGQADDPFDCIGTAWDFVKLYCGSDAEITIHVSGTVCVNEQNRCAMSGVKSVTIIGDDENLGSVIQGRSEGFYYGDGNGLCFSNVENINIENVAIRAFLGGNGSASGQCAGLHFDGTSNIKNVTIGGCLFYRNESGSIGESILFIGGTATPVNVNIFDCAFEENGETGDWDAGVIRVLDANVNMTIEDCMFSGNGKSDLYISENQSHDYEPVVTIRNSDFVFASNPNIVYEAGKLYLDGGELHDDYHILVGDGSTVYVNNAITRNVQSKGILLEAEVPEQRAPIISIADSLNYDEQIAIFTLTNDNYIITIDGYLEAVNGSVKHLGPTNYASFTKDNLQDDMTLVIHSGFYTPEDDLTLSNYFRDTLQGHGKSNITIDLSICEDEIDRYLQFNNVPDRVILPNNLTRLYNQSFEGCSNLKEIVIAASNENFETQDGVLYKKVNGVKTEIIKYPQAKEGESFTLPETVTSVAYGAFAQTLNLKTIPNFDIITQFTQKTAFYDSSVTELVFNDSITSLPAYTFQWSMIETVTLPKNLRYIEMNCFYSCANLKTITFRSSNPPNLDIRATEFEDCTTLTDDPDARIYIPLGATENYTTGELFADPTINAIAANLTSLLEEKEM